jgi:hypothetical protein
MIISHSDEDEGVRDTNTTVFALEEPLNKGRQKYSIDAWIFIYCYSKSRF